MDQPVKFCGNLIPKPARHFGSVAEHYDPGENDDCGLRIILAAIGARFISLRASDGKMCESFGQNGVVNLTEGMDPRA